MTHDDRSLERAARSWIEDGPRRAPDRVLEEALRSIATTPQERDWLPRRFPTMVSKRLVIAAMTIVLGVSAGGLALSRLVASGPGAPPSGSNAIATPDAGQTIGPSASFASPAGATITASDVGGAIGPGTYRIEGFATPFSLTVPSGWVVSQLTTNSFQLQMRSDGTVNLYLAVVDKVYPDPCHPTEGPEVVGPRVDDLVKAFSSMRDFEVTDVKAATVGGATGTSLRIRNSIDVAAANCVSTALPIATYRENGEDVDIAMFGGESDTFWVLDAGSSRVFMAVTEHALEPTTAVRDSILFER